MISLLAKCHFFVVRVRPMFERHVKPTETFGKSRIKYDYVVKVL